MSNKSFEVIESVNENASDNAKLSIASHNYTITIQWIYVGLIGIAMSVGLAGWMVIEPRFNVTLTLLQVVCILISGFIVLIIDRVSKQTWGLPNIIAAVVVTITAVLIQSLFYDIPLLFLAVNSLAGFIIGVGTGWVASRARAFFLVPLAALASTIFIGVNVWNQSVFTPMLMWHVLITTAISLLALSSLAPTRNIASAGNISAGVLLLTGAWFWPVVVFTHNTSNWHIPTWLMGIEICVTFLFLVFTQYSVGQFWLLPDIATQVFVRQFYLVLMGDFDNFHALHRAYSFIDKTKRIDLLGSMLSMDILKGWEQVVKRQETLIGHDSLVVVAKSAQESQGDRRMALLQLLINGVQESQSRTWKACLDKLITLDQKAALRACRQRLNDSRAPMYHFLAAADFPFYLLGVLSLADFAEQAPKSALREVENFLQGEAGLRSIKLSAVASTVLSSLIPNILLRDSHFLSDVDLDNYVIGLLTMLKLFKRPEFPPRLQENAQEVVTSFLETEASSQHPDYAAVALAILASLNPEILPQMYVERQRDCIAGSLLKIAEKYKDLRELIASVFSAVFQINLSDDLKKKLVNGQIKMGDWTFPFNMRSYEGQEDGPELHLEELVNEPDDSISAAHITAWIYRQENKISHLALAGHSNATICKQVSAKLLTTFMEEGSEISEGLMVPGAFLMETPQLSDPKRQGSSIQELLTDLTNMQELTGLVHVQSVNSIGYVDTLEKIKQRIRQEICSTEPKLLYSPDSGGAASAVYLPFYVLNPLDPLDIDLSIGIFQTPENLIEAHKLELRYEMIADAKRRKRVYEEWLERDEMTIRRSTHRLFKRLLPDILDYTELTEAYVEILHEQPAEQLPSWIFGLPQQARSSLVVRRSNRLRQFVNSQKPGVINSDAEWDRRLKKVQDREFPVQGTRDYTQATVADTGKILGHISLQESVEWNLPSMIRSDEEWIKRMEDLISKFEETDPDREARMDAINRSILLDSFLRGWPPVFLPDKDSRDQYKVWCEERRQIVWQTIREQLMERGIRMDPLQADNVVFSIHQINERRIKITPYYLATDNDWVVLLHPRFGITYYVNAWQYRKRVTAEMDSTAGKRALSRDACKRGEQAITIGKIDSAVACFRAALRIHPMVATRYIFSRFWTNTSCELGDELDDLMELVKAVTLFSQDRDLAVKKLEYFVEHYPNFLSDPYLLLGYHNYELTTKVPDLESKLCDLQNNYKQLIESIREDEKNHNQLAELLIQHQKRYNKQAKLLTELQNHYNELAEPVIKLQNRRNRLLKKLEDDGVLVYQTEGFVLSNHVIARQARFNLLLKKLAEDGVLLPKRDSSGKKTGEFIVRQRPLWSEEVKVRLSKLKQLEEIITRDQRQLDELEQLGTRIEQESKRLGLHSLQIEIQSKSEDLELLRKKIEKKSNKLRHLRSEIDRKASELSSLQEKIESVGNELREARRQAWHSLQNVRIENIRRAMVLDAKHLKRVSQEGLFIPSSGYSLHLAPLHGLLKGNEYLQVEEFLREELYANGENLINRLKVKEKNSNSQKVIMDRLLSIVGESLSRIQYLENQEISALQNLQDLLEKTDQVDSITREQIIRHSFNDTIADYARRACKLYDSASFRAPEITELRKQLSNAQYRLCQYRCALSTLIGAARIPPKNGFPNARFEIVNSAPIPVSEVSVDSEAQTIQVLSPGREPDPVLKFEGLSEAECQHLAAELTKPGYVSRLMDSNLTPAYGILLTPISVPPQTQAWQEVIQTLEPWLLRTLAYIGTPPAKPEEGDEERLKQFDDIPIIEEVVVDAEAVHERFLSSLGLEDKVIVKEI